MVHATKLIPTLGVSDIDAACAFYIERLGFTLDWAWGDPPDHVSLALGEVEIHLATGIESLPGQFSLYIAVDDVDAMYQRCLEGRVETGGEPEDKPWNTREFSAVDLNGYRFVFGEEITNENDEDEDDDDYRL